MVTTLSNNIGCTLSRNDVKDIYRVRGKKEGMSNTPIIVETSSTLLKNDILTMSKTFNAKHKAKLCAKHLGLRTSEDTPIFITENLTAKSARLHFLGRDLVKSKLYKFCWTSYGKVYIRKDENSPVIMLQNEMQIQQLFNVNWLDSFTFLLYPFYKTYNCINDTLKPQNLTHYVLPLMYFILAYLNSTVLIYIHTELPLTLLIISSFIVRLYYIPLQYLRIIILYFNTLSNTYYTQLQLHTIIIIIDFIIIPLKVRYINIFYLLCYAMKLIFSLIFYG